MSTKSPAEALEGVVARLERRLEIVRGIQELVKSDPALADELRTALVVTNGATNGRSGGKTTHFEKIVQFFEQRGNAWATVNVIAGEIGMDRGAVAFTFYKAHPRRFEKRDCPGKGRTKQWRFKGGDA